MLSNGYNRSNFDVEIDYFHMKNTPLKPYSENMDDNDMISNGMGLQSVSGPIIGLSSTSMGDMQQIQDILQTTDSMEIGCVNSQHLESQNFSNSRGLVYFNNDDDDDTDENQSKMSMNRKYRNEDKYYQSSINQRSNHLNSVNDEKIDTSISRLQVMYKSTNPISQTMLVNPFQVQETYKSRLSPIKEHLDGIAALRNSIDDLELQVTDFDSKDNSGDSESKKFLQVRRMY